MMMAINEIKGAVGACLLLISLFVLAACSTGQTSSSNPSVEAQLHEKTKIYKTAGHGIAESDIQGAKCVPLANKVKAAWNWQEALGAANSCIRAHNFELVGQIANALSTKDPSAPWGPYYLAQVAREKGEIERAQWMVELALKRAADLSVVHYLKGQILWQKKDFKGAVGSFETALNLDDGNLTAHLFLGKVYFRDQDFSKSSKHFFAVLKYEPRQSVALAGLAESQLRDNNPQGALEAYNRLAEAYPEDGQYWSRIGEIYESSMNDNVQALVAYRRLHELIKTGVIKKNVDPHNDSKIHELEVATSGEHRAVATTDEKAGGRH